MELKWKKRGASLLGQATIEDQRCKEVGKSNSL